jgi:hypothetical protein
MRGLNTTSASPGGWSLWVRDCDDVRHFIVALAREADAVSAVLTEMPRAQLLSSEPLPRDLVLTLDVPPGEVKEWAAIANVGLPAVEAEVRFRRRAD